VVRPAGNHHVLDRQAHPLGLLALLALGLPLPVLRLGSRRYQLVYEPILVATAGTTGLGLLGHGHVTRAVVVGHPFEWFAAG
jgi:hypothetical protein